MQEELAHLGAHSATLGQEVETLKEDKRSQCRQLVFIQKQHKLTDEKVAETLEGNIALIRALRENLKKITLKGKEKEKTIEKLHVQIYNNYRESGGKREEEGEEDEESEDSTSEDEKMEE